jgi:transposase
VRASNDSRFHLAVDANGLPLAVTISAGNANEQRFLLPLIDRLCDEQLRPGQVWADRGYWSAAIRDGLTTREITPMISRRRNPNEPIPDGTPTRTSDRGRRKRVKPLDPHGRHRWPIERTNAWLHNFRRIHTRRDVKLDNYQAFFTVATSLILTRKL